jgi:hypothetical protein
MDLRLYIQPKQKRQLAERARLRGNTFSEEISCALDFYLSLDICAEDELTRPAHGAKLSAERIITKLDATTTYLQRAQAKVKRPSRSSRSSLRS